MFEQHEDAASDIPDDSPDDDDTGADDGDVETERTEVPIYTPVDFTRPLPQYPQGANVPFTVAVNEGGSISAEFCTDVQKQTLVIDAVYDTVDGPDASGNFEDPLPISEYQPATPWDIVLHLAQNANTNRAILIRVYSQCGGAGSGVNYTIHVTS